MRKIFFVAVGLIFLNLIFTNFVFATTLADCKNYRDQVRNHAAKGFNQCDLYEKEMIDQAIASQDFKFCDSVYQEAKALGLDYIEKNYFDHICRGSVAQNPKEESICKAISADTVCRKDSDSYSSCAEEMPPHYRNNCYMKLAAIKGDSAYCKNIDFLYGQTVSRCYESTGGRPDLLGYFSIFLSKLDFSSERLFEFIFLSIILVSIYWYIALPVLLIIAFVVWFLKKRATKWAILWKIIFWLTIFFLSLVLLMLIGLVTGLIDLRM